MNINMLKASGGAATAEAQKAVLAWEKRNPHEHEVGSYLEIGGRRLGPFYTFGEISLKNRASWMSADQTRRRITASKPPLT